MKILIIRFSSIGDIVLTTPVIRCLKKQLHAEIHFITKKAYRDVLIHNPYIDKLHLLEDDLADNIAALKKENFDFIIDLHHNLRSLRIRKALPKKAYAFNKLNLKKWLLVNLKIDRMPGVHIVDRYMDTVKNLGVVNDGMGLDYFIHEDERVPLNSLPESHRQGFIGIAMGAQHATKRLPAKKILELCRQIGKPVILLGGPEDAALAEEIVAGTGSRVYNACGKYKLNQSASLVQQAEKIISHDTGLMHIAAAYKKDIVSVWGNTVPEFGMYPYLPGASLIAEVKGLSCRPCSKIGYEKCPKGHFNCMNRQDLTGIAHYVNS